MSTKTVFVRSTKTSDLRAKANNLRACSTEACNVSICSMPSKLKDTESGSGSIHERMSLPEKPKPQSNIPLPKMKTPAQDATNAVAPRKSHLRVLTKDRVRALQTQYQRLECLQSAFFEKLQSLGPEESKMMGSYKFVAIAVDEDSKRVDSNEDPIRLRQNLPTDSVQDLKNRCQATVSSGFMMLYDHLDHIQLAKSELEACIQKDKLTVKLKDLLNRKIASIFKSIDQMCATSVSQQDSLNKDQSRDKTELWEQKQKMEARLLQIHEAHNGEVNRLKADLEGKLKAVQENWRQTVGELKEMLRLYETQNNENLGELAKQNATLTAKDNTIASMKTDMDNLISCNMTLDQLVKESEAIVLQARTEGERNREYIVSLEEELREERQLIVQQQNVLDKVVLERDQRIADLNVKVLNLMQFKTWIQRQVKNTRKLQTGNEELDAKIKQTRAEISQLEENLKSTSVQLESSYQREQQLHSHLKDVKSELFKSEQLVVQMRDAANAARMQMISTPKDSQQKIDQLRFESAEKDRKMNKLIIQLESKEEQLRHIFGKLNRRQEKLKCMEKSIKLLRQQNFRLSQLRDRQRENEILMEREISQLMDSIKVYQDHIKNNKQAEQSTELNGCYCIKPSIQNQQTQENFQLHGNYFRPIHSQLTQRQHHRYFV